MEIASLFVTVRAVALALASPLVLIIDSSEETLEKSR